MSLDIEPILESIGEDIIAEMQSNLEKNKPGKKWNSMASGNLYGSFATEIKNNVLEITSSAEYSGDVDLGMPPTEVSQSRSAFCCNFLDITNAKLLLDINLPVNLSLP